MQILIFILLTFGIFSTSSATSVCGDDGAVYLDDNMCKYVCSNCSIVKVRGNNRPCDTSRYKGFVYFNNKTYAISIYQGFWSNFNNLAMPKTQEINNILKGLVSYYNTTAWIGLYDPNNSASYNSIDITRFIWRDGTGLGYENFKTGEPNNYLATEDVNVVPVYGEHWVQMLTNGEWNDIGYHKAYGGDYKPRLYALVEWDGVLSCVDTYPVDQNASRVNLTDIVCNGQTPCFACTEDGANFSRCNNATNVNTGANTYSCPINRTRCKATYINPTCPSGGTYNANTGKCETNPI